MTILKHKSQHHQNKENENFKVHVAYKNLVKSDKASMKSIWSIVLELLEDTNDIANDEIYKKNIAKPWPADILFHQV